MEACSCNHGEPDQQTPGISSRRNKHTHTHTNTHTHTYKQKKWITEWMIIYSLPSRIRMITIMIITMMLLIMMIHETKHTQRGLVIFNPRNDTLER